MLKDMVKTGGVLFLITFLVALMLVVGNYYTKNDIQERLELEETAAKQQVLPHAAHFEEKSPDILADNEKLSVAYDADNAAVGFCVTTVANGYGGEITVMTGLNFDKTVAAVRILNHSETASVGSKAATNPELLLDSYVGRNGPFTVSKKKTTDPNGVAAISGATVTSRAVNDAINRAITLANAWIPAGEEGMVE